MGIRTDWDANVRPVLRELDKLRKANVRLEEQMRKLTRESKKATAEERQLARAAKRVYDETRTPQERHLGRMRELNRMLEAGVIKQDTFRRAAKRSQEEASRGTQRGQQTTWRWLTDIRSLAAGYLSVYQAVNQARRAVEDLEEARRKAKETTVGVAETEAKALLMLPEKTEQMADRYQKAVERMAAEYKPRGSKRTIHEIMTETLSAAGQLPLAEKAAEIGVRFAPFDPETAKAMATGALDLAQALGEQKDLMKPMGWMLAALSQSRVVSPVAMAKYGAPAIAGMTAAGMGKEEAASLFNAISKILADPEGRRTRTAAVNLAKDLAEFLPEKDVFETIADPLTGVVQKTLKQRGTGLRTFEQRWEALRKDEELRQRFAAKVLPTAPAQVYGAYAAFAQQHPDAAMNRMFREAYEQSLRAMPTVQQGRAEAEKTLRVMMRPYTQKVARAAEVVPSVAEQLRTETATGRRMAEEGLYTWEALRDLLQASGKGYFERLGPKMRWYGLPGMRREQFEQTLRERAAELRGETVFGRRVRERAPTPDELRRAQILEQTIEDLRARLGIEYMPLAVPPHPVTQPRGLFGSMRQAVEQEPFRQQLADTLRQMAGDPERGRVQRAMAQRGVTLLEQVAELLREQNSLLKGEPAAGSAPPPLVTDYTAEPAFTNN